MPRLFGLMLVWWLAGCDEPSDRPAPAPGATEPAKHAPPPPRLFNYFDVSGSLISVDKIERGGPERDGIPAIDQPKFVNPGQAGAYLQPDDLVLSVTRHGITRAYPHRILDHHEIVNDRIGEDPLCVTYCPLCGSGMVFERRIGDEVLDFGVSGLLYQSDVLMYDRQTESLWSQIRMQAVTGQQKGTSLRRVPAEQMTFQAWRKRYPTGQVLSTNTGHARRYANDLYVSYRRGATPMFDVGPIRDELPAKSWVIGLVVAGRPYAIPVDRVSAGQPLNLELAGQPFEVKYDRAGKEARVRNLATEKSPPFTVLYWFAWQAFHRDTDILPPS